MRCMEDFLIHPTITSPMDDLHATMLTGQDMTTMKGSLELHTAMKMNERRASHAMTLRDPLDEQLYYRGYCSDEEAVSPSASTDSDNASISSASSGEIVEAIPARLSLIMPEELAQSFRNIERSLLRARAVVLRPINRPNSPTSPRIIDIPRSLRSQRASSPSAFRPPISRLQRPASVDSRNEEPSIASTPRTSSEQSSVSTPTSPPTSIDERSPSPEHALRKKPTMPIMRTPVAASPYPYELKNVSKPNESFLDFLKTNDPYPLGTAIRDHIVNPLIPNRHRLRKFSSSLNITKSSKSSTKRKDSADENAFDETPNRSRASLIVARQTPSVYTPTTRDSSTSSRPRMVARGASERTPVLVLPACPKGYNADREVARPKMRTEPRSYAPTGAPRRMLRRQHSDSTDDVAHAM
jgi:hypothetical protein